MPYIEPVSLESANDDQKIILSGIKAKMGKVPNIYATIAHSPSTLKAMLDYHDSLKGGILSAQEIEAIALAVGEVNACEYCLAAHTVVAKMQGLSEQETIAFRKRQVESMKLDALVKLAASIAQSKGNPSEKALETFRAAGYSDAALVEVVAWVSYNTFTNYMNHIAETDVDFPAAPALA